MRGSISGNSTQDNHRNAQLIRVCQQTHLIMKEFAWDSTGRLMEQSGNGMASRMAGRRAQKCSRSYGRQPALIPVVRYNSRFNILFTTETLIYRLQ